MKGRAFIWIMLSLFLTACYTDNFLEENKEAFYKLYGNGMVQEAVSMDFARDGSIYLLGNEFISNQDSASILLIKADAAGNQLWARKYFGKGHNTAKSILSLPGDELLVLASSRVQDELRRVPVLYRFNEAGELLNEYFIEQEEGENASHLSNVPEDMVLGEGGKLYLLGNIHSGNGSAIKGIIQLIDLQSGELIDQREFSNSEVTEAKRILRYGDKCLVLGETRLEVGEARNQSVFLAAFTPRLVEADHKVVGSAENDFFKKAFFSSGNELVILSTQENAASAESNGVLNFIQPNRLVLSRTMQLEYDAVGIPEAIVEDENGDFYVALNASTERGGINIQIYKIDDKGNFLLEAPAIGGGGNDKIARMQTREGYLYLLKTIDMQNENTLISLSRLRF